MNHAIDAKNTAWTGMLASLSPEITHHLKSRAQTRVLDLLPSPRAAAAAGHVAGGGGEEPAHG